MIQSTSPKEIWPNFFIVGAARSGTTSLYKYLEGIPSVYMSPVKEPSYFAEPRIPEKTEYLKLFDGGIHDRTGYLKLFEDVKEEVAVGEASTNYLWRPEAAKRIHDTVPGSRIIMILRHPVERAFSQWCLSRVTWDTRRISAFYGSQQRKWKIPTFHEAIKDEVHNEVKHPLFVYIEQGFYAKHLKRYLDIFASKNVKVLIFEEFIRDPNSAVSEVLRFLEVDVPDDVLNKSFEQTNASTRVRPRGEFARRVMEGSIKKTLAPALPTAFRRIGKNILLKKTVKPEIPSEDRKFLEELYKEDLKRLREILGRPLPWSSWPLLER